MGKRLQTVAEHVTDITISTATVDIQVMRIGTKQMTLAVFRQLPHKSIFAGDGSLLGAPWGWVNYDRDYLRSKPFVFSHRGILYRCDVHLEDHRRFIVEAEMEEIKPRNYYDAKQFVPTGKWLVRGADYYGGTSIRFDIEYDAKTYLVNRLHSVDVLKEAPQLFIGV